MLYEAISSIFLLFCVLGKTISNKTLIATPFGKFPADCVHVAEENNATLFPVENGVWVHYPESGRRVFHPELPHCMENLKTLRQSRKNGVQILTEWEDYASATMPETMGVFTAEYTLPSASPDATGGELLYFFIGMQDDGQPDVTIIQPVVSFCAESTKCDAGQQHFLPIGWSMMATNCCPSGQTWYGPIKVLANNDKVSGSCGSDGTTVSITMTNIATGDTSSLSQPDTQRRFNWAAATLEQYYADVCTDYNSEPFTFNNMTLIGLDGGSVTPDWKTTTGSLCGAKVVVTDPFNLAIYGSTSK